MFGQVNIPDANFKAYLVGNTSINTNGDTEIQVSEAIAFLDSVNCGGLGIFDLTGIEAFTALNNLNCEQNQPASLDVSANIDLTSLGCNGNQLTNLDVNANTALTTLKCISNQLTNLDLRNGNNINFRTVVSPGLRAVGNPNLTCINVDDSLYSANNWFYGNVPNTEYRLNPLFQ